MNQGMLLADTGNVGLLVSAALTIAAVIAYQVRAHDDEHGKWWATPFGVHLMCFMIAFAWVLGQGSIYLLATGNVLVSAAPFRPDWFAWERVISFVVLIPPVLAWRLWIILRPPKG